MSASSWIGVDVSTGRRRPLPKALMPLLVLALLAALGVAALRIDLIRARYAMSAVLAEEEALLEERRKLIVRRRQLRDPMALALHARERGFVQPTRVLALPEPTPRSDVEMRPLATLPGVAAPPPNAPEGAEWQ